MKKKHKVNVSETAELNSTSTSTAAQAGGQHTPLTPCSVNHAAAEDEEADASILATPRAVVVEPTDGGTIGTVSGAPDPELELFMNARINQATQATETGQKLLETIPIRKPSRETWVRTHSNFQEYWYQAPVIELKENNETYFLTPEMHKALSQIGEKSVLVKMLALTCGRNGVLTLWPLRTPGQDGRLDDWSASALNAAAKARTRWIRLVSNKSLGAYEIMQREVDSIEPQWPDLSMAQIMKIAFKGKIIDSMEHPVIRELRGKSGGVKERNAFDEISRFLNS